jgi:hypothetical protein
MLKAEEPRFGKVLSKLGKRIGRFLSTKDNGPINIMEALNVVFIQDPSSTPRCSALRMSASPTLIKRPMHVAMSAPRSTPATPSSGRVVTTG